MRHTVNLPKLGDTTEDVLVVEWTVEVGADVGEGDTLFTAETDKVDVEVPSPMSGRLLEQLVAEGDEVKVGAPVAVLES